jgi:hypothetical protein
MNQVRLWTAILGLASVGWAQATGSAQGSTSAQAGSSAAVQSEHTVNAALTKSVDAKKAKEGDAVEAKTSSAVKTAGGADLPKGTKLVGHVSQAKARAKGSETSTVGIVFDKAVLKNGQELPFHALIMAAAVPQNATISSDSGMETGMNSGMSSGADQRGASPLGGVTNTAGGVVNGAGRAAGGLTTGASETAGSLGNTATSQTGASVNGSVRGLPGVTLDATASNSTNGTVFMSNSQNIKLESGTLLILRISPE